MRRAMLAGVAVLALGGPARAADLGIPIDVFGDAYRDRIGRQGLFITVPEVDCRHTARCAIDLDDGIVLTATAAEDGGMVEAATLALRRTGPASTDRWTEAGAGLLALLSPATDAPARVDALIDLLTRASAAPDATATAALGPTRYTLRRRPDGTVTLAAARM